MLKFVAKDGSTFIFREPKVGDAKACQEYLNELVREGAPLALDKEMTLKEGRAWLKEHIHRVKRGQTIMLVAEKSGEIVSICQSTRKGHKMIHVADFGVSVKKKYRRIGIAEAISSEVLRRAKEEGVEIVRLWVFEDNKAAKALYRKLGFVKEFVLEDEIKDDGKYKGLALMSLYLRKKSDR